LQVCLTPIDAGDDDLLAVLAGVQVVVGLGTGRDAVWTPGTGSGPGSGSGAEQVRPR
jgi:hypothetical protein